MHVLVVVSVTDGTSARAILQAGSSAGIHRYANECQSVNLKALLRLLLRAGVYLSGVCARGCPERGSPHHQPDEEGRGRHGGHAAGLRQEAPGRREEAGEDDLQEESQAERGPVGGHQQQDPGRRRRSSAALHRGRQEEAADDERQKGAAPYLLGPLLGRSLRLVLYCRDTCQSC